MSVSAGSAAGFPCVSSISGSKSLVTKRSNNLRAGVISDIVEYLAHYRYKGHGRNHSIAVISQLIVDVAVVSL